MQVAEYISSVELKDWTDLESLVGYTFEEGIAYSIFNNNPNSILFCVSETTPTFFGTVFQSRDMLWYKPINGSKIWIKGKAFNLVISEEDETGGQDLSGKANISLDNLDSLGKAKFDEKADKETTYTKEQVDVLVKDAQKITSRSYSLLPTEWNGNDYFLTVEGLSIDSTVWVSPSSSLDYSNEKAYADAGIWAIAQTENLLSFRCKTIPSSIINIEVSFTHV